ncbi:MAG: hypothetical protein IPL33_16535 [Sphingobacteriales bacterium]|nr:hypothetical protein [Sphingobacteriales bacterium]
MKLYDQSATMYRKLLNTQPSAMNRFQVNMNLARMQYEQSRYDHAIAQIDTA